MMTTPPLFRTTRSNHVLCPNRIFIKGQQRAELVVYLCCRSDDTSRPQLEASEATHAGKQIVIELLVGLGYSSLCIRYLIVVVIVSVVVIIESSSNHHRIIIVIVTMYHYHCDLCSYHYSNSICCHCSQSFIFLATSSVFSIYLENP